MSRWACSCFWGPAPPPTINCITKLREREHLNEQNSFWYSSNHIFMQYENRSLKTSFDCLYRTMLNLLGNPSNRNYQGLKEKAPGVTAVHSCQVIRPRSTSFISDEVYHFPPCCSHKQQLGSNSPLIPSISNKHLGSQHWPLPIWTGFNQSSN